jgi:sulfonate transport system substrate-binding protein
VKGGAEVRGVGRKIALGIAVLVLLGAGAACRAEPLRIRAAWVNTPSSLVPILFAKAGVAKHLGTSYVFEPVYFSASPTEVTAVAAGEIEIAALGFSSFPIAVLNAGLDDLRIICDETQDGFGDYATNRYLVRKDAPIEGAADMKGRIAAINGFGSAVDIGLRTYLMQHGLQAQRDYTIIEAPFATMKALLGERKVDLAAAALPFFYDPDLVAMARTLFTMKDALNGTELSFWTVRAGYLAKNRAVLVDLLEDTVRAYRWYADPANHQEAIGFLSRVTKQPVERLDSWAFTKKDVYRDPDGRPDLAKLQRNIAAARALGFIKGDIEVARFADLSLVAEAAQRIK